MSPLSADRQRIGLVAAGIILGLGLVVFGMTRLIPVVTASHTNAVVDQQSHCSTGEGDSGDSCDVLVSFDDGSPRIRAAIAGASPGEVSIGGNGQRVLEIYYQPHDPYHPHELADDEINDTLVILAGVTSVIVALVVFFKRRAPGSPFRLKSLR